MKQATFVCSPVEQPIIKRQSTPDWARITLRSIMVDIKSGQQRVAVKYLQSESDMMARLEDLRMLRVTFAPCPSLPQPADGSGEEQRCWPHGFGSGLGLLAACVIRT